MDTPDKGAPVKPAPGRRLLDTRGVAFIEYIMIVGIVALGAIVAFKEARKREDKVIRDQAEVVRTLASVKSTQFSGLGGEPEEAPKSPVRLPIVNGGKPTADGCFAAGTLVATSDGKRPIETVQEGDLLWARDEASGIVDLKPVLKRYVTPHQAVLQVSIATLDGGERLQPTPGHPFWVTGQGWVPAESLDIHGGLWSATGEPLHLAVPIVPVVTYETVYNFDVAEYHTYFVGQHGVLVHNGPNQTPPAGQAWCQGTLVPINNLDAIEKLGLPLGGGYGKVRGESKGLGGEVNHIPAWNSLEQAGDNRFTKEGSAPTIWMEKDDHRKMTSTGSGKASIDWRKEQADLIKDDKFCEAVKMDVDEIRKKFKAKYEAGIRELYNYLETKGISCL